MLSHNSLRQGEQNNREQLVARELHDGVCQYVIAVQMAFETFRRETMETGLNSRSHFDMGMAHFERTIKELRSLIQGLLPAQPAANRLVATVEQLSARAAGSRLRTHRYHLNVMAWRSGSTRHQPKKNDKCKLRIPIRRRLP